MPEIFIAHVPVIHDGYLRAFERHPDSEIGVLDDSILSNYDYLRKDIRALRPEQATAALGGLGWSARLIGEAALRPILLGNVIIMPDDDISHEIAHDNKDIPIEFEPIFLRWDRNNTIVNIPVMPDRTVKIDDESELIIRLIHAEARRSPSWWRRVGAAAVKDDSILTAHNSSLPTQYSGWIDGDPRITARRGESIDLSIDIHAEARLIANAAKDGVSLDSSSIYVSTFPCPNCAKLIAESGINKCYFIEGYAMVDGQDVMKAYGVEIIKIDTGGESSSDDKRALKPYKSSN